SFDSIIEWYKGTGLRPYLEQLTESDVDDFVNDVYVELKKRYKMQKNSEILFRFPRLFFIARKA
ncbi:MAG: trans-aconitate methyltransferase, partial [Ruminococcus bromii]|nr:trans-aconitate methyltransferase [Ruminococcus bromii]